MLILALDDEPLSLNALVRAIHTVQPGAEVIAFHGTTAALNEIEEKKLVPDVAFLDIEMPGMSGTIFAKKLKNCNPEINIIFVTGYSQYAVDALGMYASGYVLKPFETESIRRELNNLRHPPRHGNRKRVKIQCFGFFEVFADNKPVPFPRQKSKELLAYLVDRRGAGCTMSEIAAVLWDNDEYCRSKNNQIHAFLSDLVKALEAADASDILIRRRNNLAVDPSKFDCDYYDCLDGDPIAVNAYNGEYMFQYSWGELTTGELTAKFNSTAAEKDN